MGTRSDAARDAITVEIGFAVVTGAFVAGLVFTAVAGTASYFELPEVFGRIAAAAAALAFVARVVQVLWRFPRRRPDGEPGTEATTPARPEVPGQPGRPGRTSPDS
ncbi:DUF6332 family protein [Streptomyces sp. NPDC002018]|uniref:DUF6332 family protein n=1 Tax=Streptomyces sp. NPDC002018 TaxID=3364629 RepID=UPI003694ACEA